MKKTSTLLAFLVAVTGTAQTLTSPRAKHTAAEIEPLLAKISVYQVGADPDLLVSFNELVEDLQGSPAQRKALETRLLQFLQSGATPDGKEIAFKELALVGSNASIPVLTPMLTRAETAEQARYALAAIPGAAADDALRKSLGQSPNDRIRVGIIDSLGRRQDSKSVPALAALLPSSSVDVAAAAAAALANIGDRPALNALASATTRSAGELRNLVADAYVSCADQFATRDDKAAAAGVYKQMIAAAESNMVRAHALTGLAAVDGRNAVPTLTAAIESQEPSMQALGVRLLNGLRGPDITTAMMAEIPKTPALSQAHLLTALGYRGDVAARPALTAALGSNVPEVRAAALSAMGRLGDASSVPVLAKAAAGEGPEQAAARRALYELRGPGIDEAMVSAMGSSSGKVKAELIIATGQRAAASAAPALIQAARDTDPDVHREAMRALRNVGSPAQTTPMLDLLLTASNASERRDAVQTLAAILRRAQPAPVGAVISVYNSTSDLNPRLGLLEVLGQTSSDEALPLLRTCTKDANPEIARGAILALTAWDNPAPLMDLLNLAKTIPQTLQARGLDAAELRAARGGRRGGGGGFGRGGPPTNSLQVLAVRGVIRLMVLHSDRSASENGRLLAEAMSLSTQNAEKIAILGQLPYFPSPESLAVAQAAERDQAVANEAKVAVTQITEALKLK